jgi:hypothetical protein
MRHLVATPVVAVLLGAIAGTAFAQDPPAPAAAAPEPSVAVPAPPPAAAPAPPPPAAPPPPVAQQSGADAAGLDKPGWDFGARLGYALPFGNTVAETKLSDALSGAVPLVLEAGYRINGNVTIGGLFQYAVAQIKNCDPGADCSASVVRLGIEAIYNFNLEGSFTPWLGLGTGYEWLGASESAGGQTLSVGLHGFEFVTAHVGGDFRLSPRFNLGPFVSFSVGEYGTATAEMGGMSASQDIPDKKMHQWLQMGIRGKFGI